MKNGTLNVNKEKKIKTTIFVIAIISMLIAVVVLVALNSDAWLSDRGSWTNAQYSVGRIDYTYEINNKDIDTENQDFTATIPVVGGVKINDQNTNADGENYEKYATENFNEGITVAHILINNKSDFNINVNASLQFSKMFDDVNSQNIFYLILPVNASVDAKHHTVTVNSKTVDFKTYISSCMADYSTYSAMKTSLKNYYNNNPTLKSDNYYLLSPKKGDTQVNPATQLNFNVLIWSEYNDNLPFVSGNGENEKLNTPNDKVDSLNGEFVFSMGILQNNN